MQRAAGPTDAAAPKLGNPVSLSSMVDVAPAKLADTKIRVLNASGQGGQAGEVAGALRDLGFAQPTAANDPLYAGTRLTCQGQIRFGAAGKPGAAAVLVAPCVELYQDDRQDDSVDLAIGTEFTTLTHSDDIDLVLAGLRPDATEPSRPRHCWPRSTTAPAERPQRSFGQNSRTRSASKPVRAVNQRRTVQSSGANPRTGPARRAVAGDTRRGGHQ